MHHQFLSSSINVSKMMDCYLYNIKMYRVSPFDSHLTKQFDMQLVLGFEPFPLPANVEIETQRPMFSENWKLSSQRAVIVGPGRDPASGGL